MKIKSIFKIFIKILICIFYYVDVITDIYLIFKLYKYGKYTQPEVLVGVLGCSILADRVLTYSLLK